MLAAPMEQESQRRVLVVDDDGIIRGVLERKLAAEGYLISTAGSGSGALDLLRDGAIDLVLLDLELPDQSGIDALRQIRLSHSAIDLPVIMVTGQDATESVIEALDETANDYVTKPVDFPVLMARIKTQLTLRDLHSRVSQSHRSLIHAARMESALHLAGGFAQEIRRPLARVRSGMNGLVGGLAAEDEAARISLANMDAALREADLVVSRLVASSADYRLKLEAVNPARFCEEMLTVLAETAREAGVKVEMKLAEGLPLILASPPELKQVFLNVALNAIRAGGKDSKVVARVLEQRVPGDMDLEASRMGGRLRKGDIAVAIEIEDAGPGVGEEELQRVYDPFFKGRCPGPGAGLGLTLARNLMELHGGLFTLQNKTFGKGAKATLYLRAKAASRV